MILYIDCDGVLTDGTLTIDHQGRKLFKSFHTRDVRAIRELTANGWEVTLVTADEWEGIHHFAEKTGAEAKILRNKSDLAGPYFAVGDDAWDVRMLEQAERAFCPSDADPSVRGLPRVHVLHARGGRGVIAEMLPLLLGAS